MGERLIKASEIGEYVYCRRSWWLHQVAGWKPGRPERLAQGTALHAAHGRAVGASGALLVVGALLVAGALLLLILR